MPVFKISSTSELVIQDPDRFKAKAVSEIAEVMKRDVKDVTLSFSKILIGKVDGDPDRRLCEITYFEKLNSEVRKVLRKGALTLQRILNKSFGEQKLSLRFSDYKDQVLIDWTEESDVIAKIPIESQGPRQICWALVAALVTSVKYWEQNRSITDLSTFRSSAQELVDWIYSYHRFNPTDNKLDEYKTYTANGRVAFSYIKEQGISLLKNYEMVKLGKQVTRTTFDPTEFENMVRTRGERIFIGRYIHTRRTRGRDGQPFSIQFITKILHQGMVYGSIYYCTGDCEDDNCKGFANYDGKGIYDEPDHDKKHKYARHAVAIVGAGNMGGRDYVRIRNTHGLRWADRGYGKLPLKFFLHVYQVEGPMMKE